MACAFDQLEKMIQENVFYTLLIKEYLDKETLKVIGHGFSLKQETFVFEIFICKELSIVNCKQLATKISKIYNIVASQNKEQSAARWALLPVGNGVWSYQIFIDSEHDNNILSNEYWEKNDRTHNLLAIFFFFF